MTLQRLKIGKRDFVLLAKRDFERLAAQARRQTEDDYWIEAALDAEAKSRAKKEKPVPFHEVERELESRQRVGAAGKRRSRR